MSQKVPFWRKVETYCGAIGVIVGFASVLLFITIGASVNSYTAFYIGANTGAVGLVMVLIAFGLRAVNEMRGIPENRGRSDTE